MISYSYLLVTDADLLAIAGGTVPAKVQARARILHADLGGRLQQHADRRAREAAAAGRPDRRDL
jgi:hypothetical protein